MTRNILAAAALALVAVMVSLSPLAWPLDLLGGKQMAAGGTAAAQLLPEGRSIPGRILFVKDGNLWLWEHDAARQFTQGETWRQPQWSPDGQSIAYIYQAAYFSDLYVMDVASADFTRLTRSQSSILEDNDWVFRPGWSPDGQRLAFVSDAASYNPVLWLMNVDGSGKRQLYHPPGGRQAAVDSFSWSPDGEKLAVTAFTDSPSEIVLVDATTGAAETIAETDEGAQDPAWSPDGQWLALTVRQGHRTVLHVMRPDGSELRPIADQSPARSPTWSPDGRHLAFISAQSGAFEVWVLDVTTQGEGLKFSNARQLTRDLGIDAVSGLSWTR